METRDVKTGNDIRPNDVVVVDKKLGVGRLGVVALVENTHALVNIGSDDVWYTFAAMERVSALNLQPDLSR